VVAEPELAVTRIVVGTPVVQQWHRSSSSVLWNEQLRNSSSADRFGRTRLKRNGVSF
jgi:hypothetical protein